MKSWIESANEPDCHFPVQNLPYGVASTGNREQFCVIAIGEFVVDLSALEKFGLLGFDADGEETVFSRPDLNQFMGLGPKIWSDIRASLTDLLKQGGNATLKDDAELRAKAIFSMGDVTMHMPFKVAEYTDFYSGKQHAINVGTMFRGTQNALPPNWLHMPIGYNGRASTVIVSGTPIRRPMGQIKPSENDDPIFAPSRRLDIELEMGAVIGMPSIMGEPVTVAQADDMIFGYVLLNDWSARDIQAWEYQPLGPFQGKAFATSISPWVVTKAALESFRISTPEREIPLLTYLREPSPMLYDINLEINMQAAGTRTATTISQSNTSNLYYSAAQQLAHHASSGCKMNIGDLLGSGTISGPEKSSYGSLLEICWGGEQPFALDSGEERTFIEDGDTLTLTGWCQGDGYRIGFGQCTGTILPAHEQS